MKEKIAIAVATIGGLALFMATKANNNDKTVSKSSPKSKEAFNASDIDAYMNAPEKFNKDFSEAVRENNLKIVFD